MQYVTTICNSCEHFRKGKWKEKANGVYETCDAFPDGIPYSLPLNKERFNGCANGMKFEGDKNKVM